jgi:hypothetical protein
MMNLMSDLQTVNINQDTRMCSFDITSMYTNIPINTVEKIIHDTLIKEGNPPTII